MERRGESDGVFGAVQGTGVISATRPTGPPLVGPHRLNKNIISTQKRHHLQRTFPPLFFKMASTYIQIEERIQKALAYQLSNPHTSITQIAQDFSIPYSRLYARIRGRVGRHQRPRTNTKITEAQEAAVYSYVDKLDSQNLAIRAKHIRGAANFILKEAYIHADPSPDPLSEPLTVRTY